MKKTKISVLGAGNAGSLTALHYSWYSKKYANVEVELIYNPKIRSELVGQATLSEHPNFLWLSTGFDWYNNNIHATFKSGILYENWGKHNEKWFHPFPAGAMAMHYCPWEMQKSVLNSGHFKVIESDVEDDYDNIDSDYIIDCRGKPNDYSEYNVLEHPVNAAILAKPNWNTEKEFWSRHVATPDGWTFVIPTHESSPSNVYCVGYCYNSNITTRKEAEKNFLNLFDVEITKHLNFKNYIAKKPIIDGRVILNGNKLFFLEPLESSSCHTYMEWSKMTWNYIFNGYDDPSELIINYIQKLRNFILWHYQFGSKYETPFWNYAKQLTFRDDEFDKCLNVVKNSDSYDVMPCFNDISYAQWHIYSIKNWYDGMVTHDNK
jgi:tryptophan halogenase